MNELQTPLALEVTRTLALSVAAVELCCSCRFDQIDSDMILFLWRIRAVFNPR